MKHNCQVDGSPQRYLLDNSVKIFLPHLLKGNQLFVFIQLRKKIFQGFLRICRNLLPTCICNDQNKGGTGISDDGINLILANSVTWAPRQEIVPSKEMINSLHEFQNRANINCAGAILDPLRLH